MHLLTCRVSVQALQKFYELVLQAILRHVRFDGKCCHVCVRVCVCVHVCLDVCMCVYWPQVVCFQFIISLLPMFFYSGEVRIVSKSRLCEGTFLQAYLLWQMLHFKP